MAEITATSVSTAAEDGVARAAAAPRFRCVGAGPVRVSDGAWGGIVRFAVRVVADGAAAAVARSVAWRAAPGRGCGAAMPVAGCVGVAGAGTMAGAGCATSTIKAPRGAAPSA
jgi:hypothetical protein